MLSVNPLSAALAATRKAWVEASAVYEPSRRRLQPGEYVAICRAYTAVQAAHASLELKRRRGEPEADLTNLIPFEPPKRRKQKRRRVVA